MIRNSVGSMYSRTKSIRGRSILIFWFAHKPTSRTLKISYKIEINWFHYSFIHLLEDMDWQPYGSFTLDWIQWVLLIHIDALSSLTLGTVSLMMLLQFNFNRENSCFYSPIDNNTFIRFFTRHSNKALVTFATFCNILSAFRWHKVSIDLELTRKTASDMCLGLYRMMRYVL